MRRAFWKSWPSSRKPPSRYCNDPNLRLFSVPASENGAKFTAVRYTVSFPSRRKAWMILCPHSILLLPWALTLPTPSSVRTLTVRSRFASASYHGTFCTYSISTGLLGVLDELEQISRTSNDAIALGAIRDSRGALEKLIVKMDSLESAFDRIAERSRECGASIEASYGPLTCLKFFQPLDCHRQGVDVSR